MKKHLVIGTLLAAPFLAYAQSAQEYLTEIIAFINSTVVPLLISLAILFFIWNAFRFFIVGASNEDSRDSAKRLMLWGLLAFVLITALWGIVNMLIYAFGFNLDGSLVPDYICESYWGSCSP